MFSNAHSTFCRKTQFFFVVLSTSTVLDSTAIPERHLYGSGAPPVSALLTPYRISQLYYQLPCFGKPEPEERRAATILKDL